MEEVTHFRPSTHHHAGKPPRIDLVENSNVNPWSVLRKKHKAKISQMHVEKEKESMLCSYDDLFSGVLPLDNNCIQKPPMIQPKKQQLHYIIREEESIHLSHSWLSRSVCFEKQFGWDKLLETKLGMSWEYAT